MHNANQFVGSDLLDSNDELTATYEEKKNARELIILALVYCYCEIQFNTRGQYAIKTNNWE